MARGRKRQYVVIWWAYQRPFYAVTRDEGEAVWTANLRNGVVLELEGTAVAVRRVLDHWRRDAAGNPMPAQRRPAAGDLAPKLARRAKGAR